MWDKYAKYCTERLNIVMSSLYVTQSELSAVLPSLLTNAPPPAQQGMKELAQILDERDLMGYPIGVRVDDAVRRAASLIVLNPSGGFVFGVLVLLSAVVPETHTARLMEHPLMEMWR